MQNPMAINLAQWQWYGKMVSLDGVDINLEMVATGNAWHYSYHDKTKTYADAEKDARARKRGLWAKPNPENPYEFRRRNR